MSVPEPGVCYNREVRAVSPPRPPTDPPIVSHDPGRVPAARALSDAALRYGWRFILCGVQGTPKAKDPWAPAGRHEYRDLDGAREHFRRGFNVGLVGHNLAVLDWDVESKREALFDFLGPLPLTVETGSGKPHTYVAPDPTLPATIWVNGEAAGQVRRLPTEYVVCPPSVHPNGRPYRLLLDEVVLEPLPPAWRSYLAEAQPAHDRPGFPFDPPASISKGERHRTFFRWTRSWKAAGHSLPETLDLLKQVNEGITHPPLDEYDLERFVTRCFNQPDRPGFGTEAEL